MNEDLKITMTLPGGRRVRASFLIEEEPRIPTPHEPDVRREPTVREWHAIMKKLVTCGYEVEGKEGGR